MDNNTQNQQLSRAICFAREALYFAFHDFSLGKLTCVIASEDRQAAREALELLRYLRDVARILRPLTELVPDLEDVCLRWLEQNTTRVEGPTAKRTLGRVLPAVYRMEERLTEHLDTPPPFAKSPFASFANLRHEDGDS